MFLAQSVKFTSIHRWVDKWAKLYFALVSFNLSLAAVASLWIAPEN